MVELTEARGLGWMQEHLDEDRWDPGGEDNRQKLLDWIDRVRREKAEGRTPEPAGEPEPAEEKAVP